MKPVLASARVRLRRFTEADAAHLFELDHDPDVLRYTSQTPLLDVAAYRQVIIEEYLPFYQRYDHFGYWAAEELLGANFLGWFCLHPAADAGEAAGHLGWEPDDCEIGYRLRRSCWGRGLATEVAQALIAWAFSALEVKQVVATTSAANLASIRVLEKSGMHRCDGLYPLPGIATPFVKFSLPRAGWASNQME